MNNELIEAWHERARPNPTDEDFTVQLGCHVEEFVEMLETMEFSSSTPYSWGALHNLQTVHKVHNLLTELSTALKKKDVRVNIKDRAAFLDSVADQVVTVIGCAYCAGMKPSEAIVRVGMSNWSKFKDGHPIRDANGKIAKGPNYAPPDLTGLY